MAKTATIQDLVDLLKHRDDIDMDRVLLAYEFAEEAHSGQTRASGDPYIEHPLRTAMFLAELNMDEDTIIAGLLHDVAEDTGETLDTVEEHFGADVRHIVQGVTKLGLLKYRGVERYIENLRRMFVAMAKDIRVIIVKFADRIHNLETIDALPEEKRRRIATESLEIFAPIANRLGMGAIKGKIEDLSFRHVDPDNYRWAQQQLKERVTGRDAALNDVMEKTKTLLEEAGITTQSIHGRSKHVYSLYKKLLRKNNNFDEIHDLVALRIVVDNIHDCYAALGVIHDNWRPVKGYIKDYIAVPKPNGYQSLHTTVFCENGNVVEFQIRTLKMHHEAEHGIAAHWNYEEEGKPKSGANISKHKIEWLNHLMQLHQEIRDSQNFLDSAKLDIFENRIFVFTPNGDVIDLPEGSSVIDFAYHIHTNVGNRCVGAKINDRMASLDTQIHSGDVVEIITDQHREYPSSEWVHFARTRKAKTHIRNALNKKQTAESAAKKTAS